MEAPKNQTNKETPYKVNNPTLDVE